MHRLALSKIPNLVWLIVAYGVIAGILQCYMPQFIYMNELMTAEPWRWWTAQWVHVGWRHYLLNMIGFLCFPFIFPHISRSALLLALLIISPLLSVALYWFYPYIHAYAGLSGVLHALYAWAALDSLLIHKGQNTLKVKIGKKLSSEQIFAVLLFIGIVLKVAAEKWMGHSQTEQLIQAPVLIEAHQIGLILGVVYAVFTGIVFKIQFGKHHAKFKNSSVFKDIS